MSSFNGNNLTASQNLAIRQNGAYITADGVLQNSIKYTIGFKKIMNAIINCADCISVDNKGTVSAVLDINDNIDLNFLEDIRSKLLVITKDTIVSSNKVHVYLDVIKEIRDEVLNNETKLMEEQKNKIDNWNTKKRKELYDQREMEQNDLQNEQDNNSNINTILKLRILF